MKLFIWKDVLHDYRPGMAFGAGETLEAVLAEFKPYVAESLGAPTRVIDMSDFDGVVAEYIWGSA